jgi:hypothetical protein
VSLIIPKLKLDNLKVVTEELKVISDKKNVEFVQLLDWKWK